MKHSDAERFVLSVIIAAGLFGAGAVLFYFIDIPVAPLPVYKGPVFITIEEDPRLLSVSTREVTITPEPESTPESSEVPKTESTGPAEPVEDVRPRQTEPAPSESEERPTRGQTEPESTPPISAPENRPGRAEEQPAEEVATAGVDTGTAETEPLPSGAEEETRPMEQTDPETEAPGVDGMETPEETEAAEERGILGDLSGLDSALSESGTDTGERNTPREGNGETTADLGTAENPIDFDTLTGSRRPINLPQPKIDSDLAQKLPRFLEVVISFTLLPSGYITGLNIKPDSGNTEVDSIIQNTIRKWRFEPVPQEAGSIQVVVTYNIRVVR